MSLRQRAALLALADGEAHTTTDVAMKMDAQIGVAQHVLDALYRRSWVTLTDDGRYIATERGRRKVAA